MRMRSVELYPDRHGDGGQSLGKGLDPSADVLKVYINIGKRDLAALERIMAAFNEERSSADGAAVQLTCIFKKSGQYLAWLPTPHLIDR